MKRESPILTLKRVGNFVNGRSIAQDRKASTRSSEVLCRAAEAEVARNTHASNA